MTRFGRLTLPALALFALLLAPSRSDAACTISTSGLVFGPYNVFNVSAVSSTGSVTYRCGLFEAIFGTITVTLSTGQSGTYSPRTMRKGVEPLSYNLYLDAAATSIWGNGSGGTQMYSRTRPPYNTDVALTVYGRLPAGQDVTAGTYTDTVSVTINF
jgi:spore coat protein U-like protein